MKSQSQSHTQSQSHSDITPPELVDSWAHPEIDQLDKKLRELINLSINIHNHSDIRSNRPNKNFFWLEAMRMALGLRASGLAEKLKVKRQAIQQYEKAEQDQTISIKTLHKIADAYDCNFICGFVPKHHNTFAEMITAKVLRNVQNPKIDPKLPLARRKHLFGHRIKMFLSQPTGWGHIWKTKKALSRPYNWLWADSELAYHPHGIREPKISHDIRMPKNNKSKK